MSKAEAYASLGLATVLLAITLLLGGSAARYGYELMQCSEVKAQTALPTRVELDMSPTCEVWVLVGWTEI